MADPCKATEGLRRQANDPQQEIARLNKEIERLKGQQGLAWPRALAGTLSLVMAILGGIIWVSNRRVA